MTGKIHRLNTDYGFIRQDSGDRNTDIFFHRSSLQGVAWHELKIFQRVECDAARTDKGLRASQVRVLD